MVKFIRGTKIKLAGHVWRADGNIMIIDKCDEVRPRKRWKWLKLLEILEGWKDAYDSDRWKKVILTAKSRKWQSYKEIELQIKYL